MTTPPRSVEARIDWFLSHNPSGPGMCAQHSWHSLGGDYGNPPAWGAPNANAVYDKVRASGRYWTTDPPRGALIVWKYGANGHAAISQGGGKIATTDPTNKPGKTGTEPLSYPERWGATASARIWTDQYNGVRFDVAGTAPTPGKVYVSKLVHRQDDSDSVRRMQDVLNGITLTGGQTLPMSGNYLDQTRAEVGKWQTQKATDKTVTDGSKVTPAQANQMFAGTGHTVVDDVTVPEPPPVDPPDAATVNGFGLWQWYSGKPSGDLTVHPDGEWHRLGFKQPASKITADSTEFHFLYLRVELPKGRTADRVLETKFVRSDGDATAYDSEEYGTKKDSHPYYNMHFEAGSGLGGEWWVKVTGGTDPIRLTTRYAKTHIHYLDAQAIARMAAG